MKAYIVTQIVQAEPMDEFEFLREYRPNEPLPGRVEKPGYRVVHADGYVSWFSQSVFEEVFRLISNDEKELI